MMIEKEKGREKQEKERVVAFYNDGNGRNEAVEQQQQQQQQRYQAISVPKLSPTEVEELSDRQKASIAYRLTTKVELQCVSLPPYV